MKELQYLYTSHSKIRNTKQQSDSTVNKQIKAPTGIRF